MGNILSVLLYLVVLVACAAGIFILGRKYVYSRVRINKFIPLGLAILGLVLQFFLAKNNIILNFAFTLVILYFFLWFMDIQATGGPKAREKEIVIKPKAKPNRAKNINKDSK